MLHDSVQFCRCDRLKGNEMKRSREASPNTLLRQERLLRGWSQKKLAETLGSGVDPQNIRRWELGQVVPNKYYQERLCVIFGKTAEELGFMSVERKADTGKREPAPQLAPVDGDTVAPSPVPPPATVWNVPYRRNPVFTGRDDILHSLHDTLATNSTAALTQALAMSGLGGIGKTSTAVEYAYRYRGEYQAVLWVRADSHELLVSDFVAVANLLNLPEKVESDQSRVVQAVNCWLNEHTGWLLILDNADDLEAISAFIPTTSNGHTLLTTRVHASGGVAQSIEITKLAVDEGTRLLLQRAKLVHDRSDFAQLPAEDLLNASTISRLMDGLPLALDQAGAYIEETQCSLSTYLALYQTRRATLLKRRGKYPGDHPEPVATTWSLSFEKVRQANPAAAELLQLCAFLHPDAIPEDLLTGGAPASGPLLQPILEDALALNDAIGNLLRYSLVRRDARSQVLIIHRLVQDVLKDQLECELSQQWVERVVSILNYAFPAVDFATWDRCQRYLPHLETCAALIAQHNIISAEAAQLLKRAGMYLRKRSQFAEAGPLLKQALLIQEQLSGPEHLHTLEILNELAPLYYEQARFDEAETLYRRILATYETYKEQETKQVGMAETLFNLAELYHSQGRYAESETRLRQALECYEQHPEAQHVAIARCLNNLADLHYEQGRYADAGPLWRRSLSVLEQELGHEHPETAVILDNLGVLSLYLARYAEAELYLQRTLTIRERVLGAEHRLTATSLNNLGVLRQKQQRYREAEKLLLRGLTIREKVLGEEHPDTANMLKNLANVYKEQGRYAEAEQLLLRSLSIYEQHLGQKHLHTAISMSSLAALYAAQGNNEKAEPLYRQALLIYEQQSYVEHPRLALCLSGLAQLCQQQARYVEAKILFRRALTIYEQTLGTEHPDTITVAQQYTDLVHLMGVHTRAASLSVACGSQAFQRQQEGNRPR